MRPGLGSVWQRPCKQQQVGWQGRDGPEKQPSGLSSMGAPSIRHRRDLQQGPSEVSPALGQTEKCPGPFPWGRHFTSGLSLIQVGCFLKTPRFPIWVVCSESHFSVLFSLQPGLLRDWRTERLFDLYYYDGLANQQEQIRLTIGAGPPPIPREPPGWSQTPAFISTIPHDGE